MLQSYKIPAALIDKFEEKIVKLNKRAKKIGVKEIEYKRIGVTTFERDGEKDVPCVTIELNQEDELKIGGYVFKAKLQKNVGDTYIYMGDEAVPQEQKDIRECQHCNTNRVRKFYYVLQSDVDGSYITVGKSCLKDFIGYSNIESVADFFQDIKSLEGEFSFGGNCGSLPLAFSVDQVLRVAYVSTEARGYVKSSVGYDDYEDSRYSTKNHVFDIFYNYDKVDTPKVSYKEYRDLFNKAIELDASIVEEMKEYILNQEANTSFMQNLHSILKDNFVIEKMFGYMVCIPNMYKKAKERELKEQLQNRLNGESGYVGVVGDKITVDVVFINIVHCDSNYGLMGIYTFLDESNNQIVWKTSVNNDLTIGDKVTLTAKVKEHNEYSGIKQTVVSRPKFVSLGRGSYEV